MNPIRIFLIDDHPKVLTQIEERLEQEDDFKVVGKASSWQQAKDSMDKSNPEVLLIDPVTPNGLDVDSIKSFKANWPAMAIVVLTAFVDTNLLVELKKLGVCQVLEKGFASQNLIDVLRFVGSEQSVN
ncbi:MAG: response regulator transcription factor [Anaerolineales bacterium]|nr:response regulator transcription factor [Anaerolineales bacterium]